MNVSEGYISHIVGEIDFALKKMSEAEPVEEKLYYFSAVHGIINRVVNFQYDPILIFAHQVLFGVHSAFASRFAAMKAGGEKHMELTPEIIKKLQKNARRI